MTNLASLKPVTLRLPEDDLSYVRQEAEALGVSTGVYLRILVRQSLERKRQVSAQQKATALQAMSELLAPAAKEQGLSEKDILTMTKKARKELAPERNERS